MKFKEFLKKFKREVGINDTSRLTTRFELEKRDERVWLIHQNIEATKRLIFATWGLVIITSILSALTITMGILK